MKREMAIEMHNNRVSKRLLHH
jgi:hypothetical protein